MRFDVAVMVISIGEAIVGCLASGVHEYASPASATISMPISKVGDSVSRCEDGSREMDERSDVRRILEHGGSRRSNPGARFKRRAYLVRAPPEKFDLIDQRKLGDVETWAHLAVCGDEVYVRDMKGLTAYKWPRSRQVSRLHVFGKFKRTYQTAHIANVDEFDGSRTARCRGLYGVSVPAPDFRSWPAAAICSEAASAWR